MLHNGLMRLLIFKLASICIISGSPNSKSKACRAHTQLFQRQIISQALLLSAQTKWSSAIEVSPELYVANKSFFCASLLFHSFLSSTLKKFSVIFCCFRFEALFFASDVSKAFFLLSHKNNFSLQMVPA